MLVTWPSNRASIVNNQIGIGETQPMKRVVCRLSLALAGGLSGVTFSIRRAAFASRLSMEDVEATLTTSSHTGNARKLAWLNCSGLNRSNFNVAISDRSIGAFFFCGGAK